MKNVVILGAGFAGIKTAMKLEERFQRLRMNEWRVILIDKNSYHTYTVALYEAASAYHSHTNLNNKKSHNIDADDEIAFDELLGGSVCLPIQQIIGNRNISFVQGEVKDIDFEKRLVRLGDEDVIHFEYLVLALGSEVMHFDIKGAEQCCYSLKSFTDALRIRRAIENIFANAKEDQEIRIVMIGGGATGVETIAEIATYTRHLARDYKIDYSKINIFLLEARDTILSDFASSQRKSVEERLKKLGVKINPKTQINEVMQTCVMFRGGGKCDADITLWSGGIKGPSLFEKLNGVELDKRGRIIVDNALRAKEQKRVFAIGDNSVFIDEESQKRAPATAFIAEQQAVLAAKNIEASIMGRPLKKYKLYIPGYVVSCGGKYAVTHIFGVTFSGFWGWVVKKLIDLKYFLSILPFTEAIALWFRELRIFTKND